MIIVDCCEPPQLKKLGDKVDDLRGLGDYIVQGSERKYVIERKTISDLQHSLNRKNKEGGKQRLWEQCGDLAEVKKDGFRPYVAVMGNLWFAVKHKKMSYLKWYAIQDGVAGYGVSFIHFNTESQFVMWLKYLDEKAGKKIEYTRPTIVKGERTLEEERVDVISAISGIGGKKAEELIKFFKDISGIDSVIHSGCTDSKEAMRGIIGEKNYQHLKEVFG